MKKERLTYHHGNLAESLLNAVDEIAAQFGLEAVTLRACAKRVGVSPSSAFRHYADKRALLTAFAARALHQLCDALAAASAEAQAGRTDALQAVCLAYVKFALDKPAFFRAMWREEVIYIADEGYCSARERLNTHLKAGFADVLPDADPDALSAEELLVWSAVHGLANLFVEGAVANGAGRADQIVLAKQMVSALRTGLAPH